MQGLPSAFPSTSPFSSTLTTRAAHTPPFLNPSTTCFPPSPLPFSPLLPHPPDGQVRARR